MPAQDNPPLPLAGAAPAPSNATRPTGDSTRSAVDGASDAREASDQPTASGPAASQRPPLERLDTPDLPTPPQTRASPSFSFHEERRLLKSDEYWLSHKLPRLPPAALATSPTASMDALMQSTRSAPEDTKPSPSHMLHASDESEEEEDLGPHGTGAYHGLGAPARSNSMLSPSGPEYGDYDPIGIEVHRNELNYDERLGLEEEREERALGMDDAYLPGGEDRHKQDELHEAAVDTGESP